MRELGYEEFGRRLLEEILTADRVKGTIESFVAGDFDTAVKIAGGIVKADGSGNVWRIDADRIEHHDDDHVSYKAYLHADLKMTVRVSGVPHRYEGKAMIELILRAVVRDDMCIFIEIPSVTADDVSVELKPVGRIAGVLDQIGTVTDQVRKEIVRFVNKRKDDKQTIATRTLEIGAVIEQEWQRRKGGG